MFFPQNFGEDLCTGLSLKVELLFREKWVGGCWDVGCGAILTGGEVQHFLKLFPHTFFEAFF